MLLLCAIPLLLWACAAPGDRCGGEACAPGQRCVAQQCLQSCTQDLQCLGGRVCLDGVCVAAGGTSSSSGAVQSSSVGGVSSSTSASSSSASSSASSGVVDAGCPVLDGGCWVNGDAGCGNQYKCPYGQVCVTPDDTCIPYPAPPMGQAPGAGQCGILHVEQHTYLACGLAGTFPQARNYCQSTFAGFDVARLQSAAQHTALAGFLTGGRGWLGLRDVMVEGTYTWVDGQALAYGSTLGSTPWCTAQPDNGGGAQEDCVELVGGAGTNDCWADVDCLLADRGVLCSR